MVAGRAEGGLAGGVELPGLGGDAGPGWSCRAGVGPVGVFRCVVLEGFALVGGGA
ncbi:hypothetical protein SFR_2087 [Streptomyces sp. FR-008]|nr:hypothetical protein SFR_2087 [Streptomyces sp. FR-008]